MNVEMSQPGGVSGAGMKSVMLAATTVDQFQSTTVNTLNHQGSKVMTATTLTMNKLRKERAKSKTTTNSAYAFKYKSFLELLS